MTNLFDSHLNLWDVLFVGTKIFDEVGVRSDLDLHAYIRIAAQLWTTLWLFLTHIFGRDTENFCNNLCYALLRSGSNCCRGTSRQNGEYRESHFVSGGLRNVVVKGMDGSGQVAPSTE